ncbi:hypothetical protein UFOVP826_29 [uncultured Caudovirales phage]|uniref:Uncharacterized protein n=1 Tax=uncultured Caudovirales phage TaxID=2100421 RepID=A0A6J5NZD9_9CAUD|nr:hypothetical protein UFOVP826_29 [uncultured Caudovirales phage]
MTPPYTPDAFFAWAESRGFKYVSLYLTHDGFGSHCIASVSKTSFDENGVVGKTPAEAIQKLMEMKL